MRTSSDETEFPTSTWADDSPSLRVFGLLNLSDRSRPSVLEYVPESPHASWVTTYSQVRAWMPTRLLSIFPNTLLHNSMRQSWQPWTTKITPPDYHSKITTPSFRTSSKMITTFFLHSFKIPLLFSPVLLLPYSLLEPLIPPLDP